MRRAGITGDDDVVRHGPAVLDALAVFDRSYGRCWTAAERDRGMGARIRGERKAGHDDADDGERPPGTVGGAWTWTGIAALVLLNLG